jgi:hypothetical protein
MTSPRRFEQDLPEILADMYPAGTPDYRDDLFRQTARVRQRPAWTFLARWIPMDFATRRLPIAPLPWRTIGVLVLVILLAAATLLVVVGSRSHVPAPFGPARNGPIAYTIGGDIFVRDTLTSPERILMGANGEVNRFWGFSPDGTRFLFTNLYGGQEYLHTANADGSAERQIFGLPLTDAAAAWSSDSRTVAVTVDENHQRHLYLAHSDGSPATRIELGDLQPTDVAWRPPNGAELLVRGKAGNGHVDLYLLNSGGANIRPLHLPSPLIFGPDWDVSGPVWSPTGDRIAYNAVERAPSSGVEHFRVHLVSPDGSGDVGLPGPNASIQEAWPIFSPDGRWIAVHRWQWKADNGQGWLAIIPADGSPTARDIGPKLDGGEDTGIVKAWSPDGTRILAYSNGTGGTFSIDPVTGTYEKIAWTTADLPDYRRLAP